jgi:uncharacterized protein
VDIRLEQRSGAHLVRDYSAGAVRIGAITATRPCLVTARTLVLDWPAERVATLEVAHCEAMVAGGTEVVLVGSTERGVWPPDAVRAWFRERSVALEVMDLGAACRTYNVLVQEDRKVLAALFP